MSLLLKVYCSDEIAVDADFLSARLMREGGGIPDLRQPLQHECSVAGGEP